MFDQCFHFSELVLVMNFLAAAAGSFSAAYFPILNLCSSVRFWYGFLFEFDELVAASVTEIRSSDPKPEIYWVFQSDTIVEVSSTKIITYICICSNSPDLSEARWFWDLPSDFPSKRKFSRWNKISNEQKNPDEKKRNLPISGTSGFNLPNQSVI